MFVFSSYYKCSKARSHFCVGSLKKLHDGTIVMIKQHIGHDREPINNRQVISDFRAILKRRAAAENTLLKTIYDEESAR